jgi:hypothetical protein
MEVRGGLSEVSPFFFMHQSSNNHYEIHSINLNGSLSPKVYLSCSDFCNMHYIRCSVYGLVEAL